MGVNWGGALHKLPCIEREGSRDRRLKIVICFDLSLQSKSPSQRSLSLSPCLPSSHMHPFPSYLPCVEEDTQNPFLQQMSITYENPLHYSSGSQVFHLILRNEHAYMCVMHLENLKKGKIVLGTGKFSNLCVH